MQIKELFEDVHDDVNRHAIAQRMTTQAIDHFMTGGKCTIKVAITIDDQPTFLIAAKPEDIGWNDVGRNVLLGFGLANPNSDGHSGQIIGGPSEIFGTDYNYIILVECLTTLTNAEVHKIIATREIRDVIEHEIIHYLDSMRSNGKVFGKAIDPNNKEQYYNDAAEFNAFYHDLVQNIHAFIAASNDGGPIQQLAKEFGIYPDLIRTISSNLTAHSREFMQWLKEDRRKALLKRLYLAHQEALRIIRDQSS